MIYRGDCLGILPRLEEVDSIITDPPYGWSFMDKKWDYDVPSVEVWKACLNVLKPGGHILVCCGTRTQHRMAVNIEDAGFEIRDLVAWVYGSGFPKSLDIGKAVDKIQGNERQVVGEYRVTGNALTPTSQKGGTYGVGVPNSPAGYLQRTKGNSPWEGWGTALKPSMELWTLARKPLEGRVAENVLKYGTGGLNIDGCRVVSNRQDTRHGGGKTFSSYSFDPEAKGYSLPQGRFPANLILSYPDDEYQLRDDITEEEKQKLCTWLQQNL